MKRCLILVMVLLVVLVITGWLVTRPATTSLTSSITPTTEVATKEKAEVTAVGEQTLTGEPIVTLTKAVTPELTASQVPIVTPNSTVTPTKAVTQNPTATATKAVTQQPTTTSTPVPVATKSPTLAPTKAVTVPPTIAPTSTPSPTPAYQHGYKWEYDMLDCVNAERAEEGLRPYTWSDDLAVIAQRRLGEAMAVWGTGQEHDGCVTGGENLASTGGYRLPSQVMEGWLISEGHRSVIMGDVTEDIVLPDDYPYTMVVDGVEYTAGDTISGTPVRMACVSHTDGATGSQFWIMVVEWR